MEEIIIENNFDTQYFLERLEKFEDEFRKSWYHIFIEAVNNKLKNADDANYFIREHNRKFIDSYFTNVEEELDGSSYFVDNKKQKDYEFLLYKISEKRQEAEKTFLLV